VRLSLTLPAQVVVSFAVTEGMRDPSADSPQQPDSLDTVRGLLERYLACDELAIPLLPDVAVRVVSNGKKNSGNAHTLADIINADPALTMYVLRIAASAAKRPASRVASLQHAVAWLGLDEVANIAFTLALQGKMLDVKGQQRKARRLWRHSLASALWSRQLAHMLARETGLCYLCGLLHNIGKAVTLGAVHEVAQRADQKLGGHEYDYLIEIFNRDVGHRVLSAWALPPPVPSVIARWETYRNAGAVQWESNVVNVAHKLADFTLHEPTMLTRELLVMDQGYLDLGLSAQDGAPLFDSAASINSELDRYLSP
jgi:HD-like signal output (HDOD) protein